MTINIQARANTSQAVDAFDRLIETLDKTKTHVDHLHVSIRAGASSMRGYASSMTDAMAGAFGKLVDLAQTAWGALERLAAVTGFVFTSIVKELDKIQGFQAIMSVSIKDTVAVGNSYNFLRRTADELGIQFDALTSNYAKLVAALPEGNDRMATAEKVFMGVAMAARTLHASNMDTQLMFYAVTQMASKGTVSMEELRRQLGEKLPGAIQIAARALNTTTTELETAIRKGLVDSAKFLPYFGDALIAQFAESSQQASSTVSAALNRLTNVWVDFVKTILDSGAASRIVNLFDTLREKMSDEHVMRTFAQMVDSVAEKLITMVENITAEDITRGFQTAANAIDIVIKALDKFVQLLTWLIDNSGKAGFVIGALGGLSVGASAGTLVGGVPGGLVGGGIGAVVGGIGGAVLGYDVAPTFDAGRFSARMAASDKAYADRVERERLRDTVLSPLLKNFKGVSGLDDPLLKGLQNPARWTSSTTDDIIYKILSNSAHKTDTDRTAALIRYANTGSLDVTKRGSLAEVQASGKGKGKPDHSMENTLLRALGYNTDFVKELNNLTALRKSGKLSVDEYTTALDELLKRQPRLAAMHKAEAHEMQERSKAATDSITAILRQIEVRDRLNDSIQDEVRWAGMLNDELTVERRALQAQNTLEQAGWTVTPAELEALREKYRLIERIKSAAQAEQEVLSQTVDRLLPQIRLLQGIEKGLANPKSGMTQASVRDYFAMNDPLSEGGPDYYEALRKRYKEQQDFINVRERLGYISPQSADRMRANSAMDGVKAGVVDAHTVATAAFSKTADAMGDSLRSAIESGLANGTKSGLKTFTSTFSQAIRKMGAEFTYEIAIKPFVDLVKNMAIAFSKRFISFLFSADGNAFDSTGVRKFAAGGAFTNSIVTGPTLFAFAGGGQFGVMGEAGPEAVMPLRRTRDGSLGIAASGGDGGSGVQVIVQDMRTSTDSKPVEVQSHKGPDGRAAIRVLIRDEVRRAVRSGDLDNDMVSAFGVNRNVARR